MCSSDLNLFICYDDGNSVQFVPATPSVPGPPGPAGPPGDGGAMAFRYTQPTAATEWDITHNLSFRPNVTAVDSTGREILPGTIDYLSGTSVRLTFSAAVGGEAYLS